MEDEESEISYERRLDRDFGLAIREGSSHFEGRSAVQTTLFRIAARLNELGISYAVVGGMAMFHHGLRRFTEDVDILVTGDGLKAIHEHFGCPDYRPASPKILQDTEFGVRIEFLVAGEFPGDGKPKPVAFPDPSMVSDDVEGVRYVNLPTLIELKLASGMTNSGRLKDLADVQELIKLLKLPREFADGLNPYVRDKFDELWVGAEQAEA